MFPHQSPAVTILIPKVGQEKDRVSQKWGKTAILTSLPYETELVAAKEQVKPKKSTKLTPLSKKTTIKCAKKAKKSTELVRHFKNNSKEDDNDDAQCLYCQDWYSKSTKG
jgi:hypothetical protein